jgi:hypothetical protein
LKEVENGGVEVERDQGKRAACGLDLKCLVEGESAKGEY